jgi:hypothetical protein
VSPSPARELRFVNPFRREPWVQPMIANEKTDLARLFSEPHHIAEIPSADITALRGSLELPPAVGETVLAQRIEVHRVVAEAVQGIVLGGLLTPLGLIQAIGECARQRGVRAGLAVIKQRLLSALQGLGVALHETHPASVIYPKDGPLSGYFDHSDPFAPVYWLTDEIGPSVQRAIARYRGTGR